jgi:hypothetical protein
MSKLSSLTLVLPHLLVSLQDDAGAELPQSRWIAELAGKGQLERRWRAESPQQARVRPWQRGLLETLAIAEEGAPSAPLCAASLSWPSSVQDWLHVEPIHLEAGLNEVTLLRLPPEAALTTEERDALTPLLREHLEPEGLIVRPYAEREWLIGSPALLAAQTVTPEFALRADWHSALPQGADAPRLRRLMTELQMLLHEHPVNVSRAKRGLPAINAVWFWGNGRVNDSRSASATCMGGHAYLRGLCAANGWVPPDDPDSLDAALAAADAHRPLVYVADCRSRDGADWLRASVEVLRRGRIGKLIVIVDEWRICASRWSLRRFWRRAAPFATWA